MALGVEPRASLLAKVAWLRLTNNHDDETDIAVGESLPMPAAPTTTARGPIRLAFEPT